MTKSYFDKYVHTDQKNVHVFKLLVSDTEFNKQVDEIRKKTGLDKFKGEDIWNWYEEIEKQSMEVYRDEDFKRRRKEIFDDKTLIPPERKRLSYELFSEVPNNYLNRFCRKIIEQYNLPTHFFVAINHYVMSGRKNAWGIAAPYQFVNDFGPDGQKIENELTVKIYQQLTDEDFKKLKYAIQKETKHLPVYKEIKEIEKKLAIEMSYDNKGEAVFDDEIVNNKDLAEEYLNDSEKNKDIYDKVRSIKKDRKKYLSTSEKSSRKKSEH